MNNLDPGLELAVLLAHGLHKAIAAARARDPNALDEPVRALGQAIERSVSEHAGATVRVDLEDDTIVANDRVLSARRHRSTVEGLVSELRQHGANEVRFLRALSDQELRSFLGLFRERDADPVVACRKLMEGLWSTGLRGTVDIVSLEQRGVPVGKILKVDEALAVRLAYARLLTLLAELKTNLANAELERYLRRKLQRAVRGLVALAETRGPELVALTTIKDAAEPAVNHAVNTCVLATVISTNLGLPRVQAAHVGLAALLHGMAVVAIEAEPLAAYRRANALLATHRLDDPSLACAVAAFHHDARKDQPPRRVPPQASNPLGELIGLCARWDDLTTPRPDRPALAPRDALIAAANGPPVAARDVVTLLARTVGVPAPAARAPTTRAPAAPKGGARRAPAPKIPAVKTATRRTPVPKTVSRRTARPAPKGATRRTPIPKTASRRAPAPKTATGRAPAPKTATRRTPAPKTATRRTQAPKTGTRRTQAPGSKREEEA